MIKIYICDYTQRILEGAKTALLSELDSSEVSILPNREGKDFELSLIGQVLTKFIVSNETKTNKKNILIGKTSLGKPIIKKPKGSKLDISISHSGNYLVIGVCDIGRIGIDVEVIKDIDFRIFRNCLSAGEEMYVNSGKGVTQKLENFYEIWTRKEACLKALGKGLQKPLPIMQFYPSITETDAKLTHDSRQYYLTTLKEKKFILSICTTKPSAADHIYTRLTLDKQGLPNQKLNKPHKFRKNQ